MTTKRYALTEGGPEELEVSWKMFLRDFTIRFAGETILTGPSVSELRDGRAVTLPTGQELFVVLGWYQLEEEVRLFLDGEPLPGSPSHPQSRLKIAYTFVFIIAIVSGLSGLVTTLADFQPLTRLGMGPLVVAVVFAFLGFLVLRRSMTALVTAILLVALDSFLAISDTLVHDSPDPLGPFMRIALLAAMIQGIPAILRLRNDVGHPSAGDKVSSTKRQTPSSGAIETSPSTLP